MKVQLKSLITLSLCIALLALPMVSFANTGDGPSPKVNMADRIQAKFEDRQASLDDKRAQVQDKKLIAQERLIEIIQTFAPDLEADFQSFWSQHEALHVALIQEEKRIATEKQAETMAFHETIKAQVLDKTITPEEAKAQMLAYREEAKAEREAVRAEVEALKASLDVPREAVKALYDALKVAVENQDQAAVEAALLGLIDLQPSHLTFDQAKLDLFMTK